ncbi:folylpolyglutamate synthase/dihydrofolate synthase family protein [Wenzhouxiangella sp. XN201]|uniref:bifunctional folylpolyglutamate synthase/dihydrofolate synthase n=1 Tax=Wenzhouxiangella sp. XN201 TaxID=2710755 RepID=UPI001F09123D|nr:folylpolyglutamate synthase/dihydrofolate synthase family protein [Wenzhouxiangella sp. XN201]
MNETPPISPATLADWLERLEQRAPASRIALGLERVERVWRALAVDLAVPVISVAGTNGKGSVVAMLEAMLRAGGYCPFAYTSPHLLQFNERMRIGGRPAEDADIVAALDAVEAARGEIALTYFEQTTLAALWLAAEQAADAVLLEVGLGGRLDAVNVVDADVAVITSIGIDHAEYLGSTRSAIGREKAGIARPGRPVIVGESDPPEGLRTALQECGARVLWPGADLSWRETAGGLEVQCHEQRLELPRPALAGRWQLGNAACAAAALLQLEDILPVSEAAMAEGLLRVRLPGRLERVQDDPEVILDVAHNPAAARMLAGFLGLPGGRSTAVFSALAGKDVAGIGRELDACFDRWLIAPLAGDRGQPAGKIVDQLAHSPVSGSRETVESVAAALERALADSGPGDRVVVFGSFLTVAEARIALTPKAH